MPTGYRVELASSGRAGCKSTDCKKTGEKIGKGELRFGTLVEIQEHQNWQWRHWGCTTPQILENVIKFIDGNFDLVDGVDELPEEEQAKVKEALQEGHVHDQDWNGDPEFNRPGKKGMHKRAPKGKKTAETNENEHEHEPEEPVEKPQPRKRGRPKADRKDEADNVPRPKKSRGRAKKSTEEVPGVAKEVAPKLKRGRPPKNPPKINTPEDVPPEPVSEPEDEMPKPMSEPEVEMPMPVSEPEFEMSEPNSGPDIEMPRPVSETEVEMPKTVSEPEVETEVDIEPETETDMKEVGRPNAKRGRKKKIVNADTDQPANAETSAAGDETILAKKGSKRGRKV